MLIHRIAKALFRADALQTVEDALCAGTDATLAVPKSARTLVVAAEFARHPRAMLYIVSGEEASAQVVRALIAYLGAEHVAHFPERNDLPWSDTPSDAHIIAQRSFALSRLVADEPCIMVASARSLLRCVPPPESRYWASAEFAVGDELSFEELPHLLVRMGYESVRTADAPGTFAVHGDSVDIWPGQSHNSVRLEFFGDEIDRCRHMVPATGQTIADMECVSISPVRELALSQEAITRLIAALYEPAREDAQLISLLELARAGIATPEMDRFLPLLYPDATTPLAHLPQGALVVLSEPRALFDDCMRAYEELEAKAERARLRSLDGLYTAPAALDFGKNQRLNLVSIIRAGGSVTAELAAEQPSVAGSDERLIRRISELVSQHFSCVFAISERAARESIELALLDAHIPFEESFTTAPENGFSLRKGGAALCAAEGAALEMAPLRRGRVTIVDDPLPAGSVVPKAHLAVLSFADLYARMDAKRTRRRRRIDPTETSFPFKPGDYVVHAVHGVALFSEIVRREVAGRERDYFLLEYAGGDKLYVPLEQLDRLTRYIGADSASPRLTRLNTADWSRAVQKARKSAKKLAFDLVDLYTRRSSIAGHAFLPDTLEQEEMEASFAFEPTPDQLSAIADIKADMEGARPMDRLLCGDVGFGKTEVALRAAFKCVDGGRQVMVLCPTTILAQQHYQTFSERFAPFGLEVEVMSRFRTPAQQKRVLSDFARGSVDVLIGTHRLLSSDVNPHTLGLVIIDEEQRFGVAHKEQLKNLRESVDVLTLSATPIPRTMQMAVSGVRDMSLITTPPAGRLPVSVHVGEYDGDLVSAAIRLEVARGGQVYYVSNRVKTIDGAVERVHDAAPEARVGIAHGKMSAREIEEVMLAFAVRELDVLVATTIIENGLDNPHTNTLIIEDSQRLGLAQLYQLKGRIGRSGVQAYAYFMFPGEIPLTNEAISRLTALSEFQDLGSGMRIAMRDLEIRGAGSLMGAEQHGNLSSVGFDLFTQMLGQAVSDARGEAVHSEEASSVTLNLPADFFLDEEYMPAVDTRVLIYRKLACAVDLAAVEEVQTLCEDTYGELPLAAQNLFDRARVRLRAQRLSIESISLAAGKLVVQGVDLSSEQARDLRERFGALNYPRTHKLTLPYHAHTDERGDESHDRDAAKMSCVQAALELVLLLGNSDDDV